MHETSIAQNIIDIVEETLNEHPESRLKTVRVSIGELIAVVPELLHHAYNSLSSNTRLDSSVLDISIIPVTAICQTCKKTFGLHEFEFLCPFCQAAEIEVKTGNEFFIKELEVETCP